jgi:hypothetical protein
VEVAASNREVAVWRLLSATGELRHFYKNGVGEAPTFFSEKGESILGIEIADGLGTLTLLRANSAVKGGRSAWLSKE